MIRIALGLTLLAVPSLAFAGKCDSLVSKADSAKGADLVAAYQKLLACDKGEAEGAYIDFMTKTGDAETLVDLSLAAIDKKAYTPVWGSLDKIKDYSARKQVAEGVGMACAEHPEVLTFLQGAYYGLRDIQLGKWKTAFIKCESDQLSGFVQGLIEKPPARSFDEKYNTMLKIWVERKGADGLGVLQKGAVTAAGNEGPFSSILDSMNQAVQPTELGAEISDADRKTLQDALTAVAGQVKPESAKLVADKLFNAGAEAAAASLLPAVYPDRVQSGGGMLYGVASVEICDKEAVLHYAPATDPAKRWSIITDVEAPARAFKPRLKCESADAWPVLATPEPVVDGKAIDAWITEVQGQWASKGFDVKLREEKGIALN
ncbi:MAG: hypothetical protein AB8H79_07445 [Myxococcota bacterium]